MTTIIVMVTILTKLACNFRFVNSLTKLTHGSKAIKSNAADIHVAFQNDGEEKPAGAPSRCEAPK
jgi:hypothetical protein